MKLLLCINCEDVFKLRANLRTCKCGLCGGLRTFEGKYEYYGEEARILELDPRTLGAALIHQERNGDPKTMEAATRKGRRFTAFLNRDSDEENVKVKRKETV